MKRNIIHIFLPLIIGMACAYSCTSDSEPPVLESGEELMFEVKEATDSRTVISTTSNLKQMPFALFGNMNRTGEHYQGLKIIFNGDKVTFTDKKWSYGPTPIYWLMGQEHSFAALYPDLEHIPGLSDLKYEESKVSFNYEIPKNDENITEYSKIADILVATHRRLYTFESTGAVKFNFRHVLSRINIEPALDEVLMYEDETEKDTHPDNKDEYIQFNKFEIFNLKTKASFAFVPAKLPAGEFLNDENDRTYEVDNESLADYAVLNFTNPKNVTNNKRNVNICANDDAFLVLPQSVDKDAKLILYYTVNGDHLDRNYVRTVTFPLSDLPIDKWEAGKSYTYRFTIEKAYTGQIKAGSIEWEINDRTITDEDIKNGWIDEDTTISQTFNPPSNPKQ